MTTFNSLREQEFEGNSISSIAPYNYAKYGYNPIPLKPGSVEPLLDDWTERSINELWGNAPLNANIGIQLGGGKRLAAIVCNDLETYKNVLAHLNKKTSRPRNYPTITTMYGDVFHVYLAMNHHLDSYSCELSVETGSGEFIYGPQNYLPVPPSFVNPTAYIYLSGDFINLRTKGLVDVLPILNHTAEGFYEKNRLQHAVWLGDYDRHDFNYIYPDHAWNHKLPNREKIIEWILGSLEHKPPTAESNEGLIKGIAELSIEWAHSRRWRAHTRKSDRAMLIAHAEIVRERANLVYRAGTRELAQRAGISHVAASAGTKRMISAGLVEIIFHAVGKSPNTYRHKLVNDVLSIYHLLVERGGGND